MKIGALPQGVAIPPQEAFGEARSVQGCSVRRCGAVMRIESGARFKRFGAEGREYVAVRAGEGHIKWKRGEIPFCAGDVFAAEDAEEYDLCGAGVFFIIRQGGAL